MNKKQSAQNDERMISRRRRWILLFPAILFAAAIWIFGDGEVSVRLTSKEPFDFASNPKLRDAQGQPAYPETMGVRCRDRNELREQLGTQCPSHSGRGAAEAQAGTVDRGIRSTEDLEVDEWIDGKRQWPTCPVQVGGIAYPRPALISQILRGGGADPALRLAKQVALAKLRLNEAMAFPDYVADPQFMGLLAACDAQLVAHPPGRSSREEARSKTVELYGTILERNRVSVRVDARE